MIRTECSMRFDQFFGWNARNMLQRVDVLRVVSQEQTFLVQQSHEVVTRRRVKLPRIQLFGQFEEWLRFLTEIGYLEHSRRVRKIIFLQIVIEPRFGRSKIRNASRWKEEKIRKFSLFETESKLNDLSRIDFLWIRFVSNPIHIRNEQLKLTRWNTSSNHRDNFLKAFFLPVID